MRVIGALLRHVTICAPHRNGLTSASGGGPSNQPTPGLRRRVTDALFGRYLIWTNTVSSGVLMAIGDGVAQLCESQRHKPTTTTTSKSAGTKSATVDVARSFDWRRTAIMFASGVTQGPIVHVYYTWLDRRFEAVTARNVARKVVLDQVIVSPFTITQFFLVTALMEGQTWRQAVDELRFKFLTVYMVS